MRKKIVAYLNQCLKADPDLLNAIILPQIAINNPSEDNPIMCTSSLDGKVVTGALGLLNGALEAVGENPIYAVFGDETDHELDGKLIRFE